MRCTGRVSHATATPRGRVVGEQLEEHVREPEQRVRRLAVGRLQLLGEREERAVREVVAVDEEELGVAGRRVVELELLAGQRLRAHRESRGGDRRRSACLVGWRMPRVPLLSGSRIVLVPVDGRRRRAAAAAAAEQVADVAAAVRDALRFPLSGAAARRDRAARRRATIVVEPPALPFPGAPSTRARTRSRRRSTSSSAAAIPDERQTILVAGGLGRRLGQRELERLLPPPQARAFRGQVVVHDAEARDLVASSATARVHPALVETDLVVVVTAAETVLHGGPGALVAACDAATVRSRARRATRSSRRRERPSGSSRSRSRRRSRPRVPVLGVSLVLDLRG